MHQRFGNLARSLVGFGTLVHRAWARHTDPIFGFWGLVLSQIGQPFHFSAVGLALWVHRVSTRHDELSASKKNLARQTTALGRGKTNGGGEGSGSPRRGRGTMKLD